MIPNTALNRLRLSILRFLSHFKKKPITIEENAVMCDSGLIVPLKVPQRECVVDNLPPTNFPSEEQDAPSMGERLGVCESTPGHRLDPAKYIIDPTLEFTVDSFRKDPGSGSSTVVLKIGDTPDSFTVGHDLFMKLFVLK